MNVSLKWLGTLVDIKGLDPEEMAEVLTVSGIPVEHVVRPGKGISGVVTGKLLARDKHPDADRLLVCQLDVGEKEPVQIVTSADNMQVGDIVPVALNGAHVPAKHDHSAPGGLAYGDTKIKAGKLRGVKSAGMMCSLGELGLDVNLFPGMSADGIMILPPDTPVGVDIHTLYDLDDVIFEMELTANRGDCFSMVGMAREVAAIFKRSLTLPEIRLEEKGDSVQERASVHIDTPLCSRFCGRILENVNLTRSPVYIENRLRSNGIRPINNVVDAANYVMLELGQPLHTYDYDRVAKHSLTCRAAREEETITTLDGNRRMLQKGDLVIADGEDKSVCIAGVMGGLDSEVTEKTKSVLLEAAVFDSASIRRTSRRLGLRSEASGRYERGINPVRSYLAIDRICQILEEQGACKVAKGMLDVFPDKQAAQTIVTSCSAIAGYIGISISDKDMVDILTRLYFNVEYHDGAITVTVPDFRVDVEGMPDLAEEVARVYGYATIPITTPWSAITKGMMPEDKEAELALQDALVEDGLSEVVNYSFMHTHDLKKLEIPAEDALYRAIPILNPISDEYPSMRTSLLPGLFHTLKYNLSQKNKQIAIFENGAVYAPHGLPLTDLPDEITEIAGLLTGTPDEEGYPNEGRDYDFYDVKAIAEDLLSALGIAAGHIQKTDFPVFHPGVSAEFCKDGHRLICFGEIHPKVLDNWGIQQKVYGFVTSLPQLMPYKKKGMTFKVIPRFPAAERDLAILCPAAMTNEAVERLICAAGGKHLESLVLFDKFEGAQVGEGKKSLAYSLTFRRSDRTLTDDEVSRWIEKIVKKLEEAGCRLRD